MGGGWDCLRSSASGSNQSINMVGQYLWNMVIFSTLSWSAWAEEQVEVMESLEALELQGLSVAPLSSAPATVNRVPAEAIDQLGIQTARQALELVPGVGLASSDSARATSFSVRGSRETTFHEFSGGRSGVGFYLDDLPVMDAYGRDLLMFEVEEFRVLKGPNGTAVGVPHSMGVVDVVTRAPDSRGRRSHRRWKPHSRRGRAHLPRPTQRSLPCCGRPARCGSDRCDGRWRSRARRWLRPRR